MLKMLATFRMRLLLFVDCGERLLWDCKKYGKSTQFREAHYFAVTKWKMHHERRSVTKLERLPEIISEYLIL
jgi:hypothetical protein